MQHYKMNNHDIYISNIRNLTNLWEAMGASAIEADGAPTIHASDHWPDRLWFDVGKRPQRSDALRLIAAGRAAVHPATLPVWSVDDSVDLEKERSDDGWSLASELETAGFEVSFEQTLMALDLGSWGSGTSGGADVELQRVEHKTSEWADVASRSFGYTVPQAVAERMIENPGVRLLIARKDGQSVGTGLIYADEDTAGFHMVGVVPEARRMGIARKIMTRLLDDARSRGFDLATLQASTMGEGLYRELGFEPQGRIRNFRL